MYDTTKLNRIKHLIDLDKKYSMTPDTPQFRHIGMSGIPIFLWDALSSTETLEVVLSHVDMNQNVKLTNANAMTKDKYVPWYNMGDSSDAFQAFCLDDVFDLDFLDLPEYTDGNPLNISGKIFQISLEALQDLDIFYENTRTFQRQIINVFPSKYHTNPVLCYTWLNDLDQITTFDTKSQEYLLDKDIDPTPFRVSKDLAGFETYSF